ncbi:hypothetical protein ABZ845_27630 [Streptomyces sp. NPDC047022]|uniref:hypothetical protein n=1 Tax=Streptomyces sp. NPDC047022 TaxID=3155737 RepID=UPI0033F80FD6
MTEQTERPEDRPVPEEQPTPEAAPLAAPPAPAELPPGKKDRRVLRALLRWTAVVAVFAATGGATAFGITRMERTDLPGLATASDGRWDYPELTKPPLPSGSPGPLAKENKTGTHYADQRALLLPAPHGARADAALRGTDGWLPAKTFLAEFATGGDRAEVGQLLTQYGLRHIAARGWTTEDGTHTRIYLLQFDTETVVNRMMYSELVSYGIPHYAVREAGDIKLDDEFPAAIGGKVSRLAYAESKPYGDEQVREAYLAAGDTLAVVLQSRKGAAPAVPFQQTVALQSELLG